MMLGYLLSPCPKVTSPLTVIGVKGPGSMVFSGNSLSQAAKKETKPPTNLSVNVLSVSMRSTGGQVTQNKSAGPVYPSSLKNITEQAGPKMMEQLACQVVREKAAESEDCSGLVKLTGVEGGKSTSIMVGNQNIQTDKLESLTKEEVNVMMKELDLSDRYYILS